MSRRLWMLAVCALSALNASAAFAQSSFEPRPLTTKPMQVTVPALCQTRGDAACAAPDLIPDLDREFRQGDWEAAQSVAREILRLSNRAWPVQPGPQPQFDPISNNIWVTWIGSDAFGADVLNRMLVRAPTSRPYSLKLPGVETIYEVFVSRGPRSDIASRFISTPQGNPLSTQLVDVLGKVAPVLFGLFSAVTGTPPPPAAGPPPAVPSKSIWVRPLVIDFPHRRASVAVRTAAMDQFTADEFDGEAERFKIKLAFQRSQCLQELATEELDAIKVAYRGCFGTKRDCLTAMDAALRRVFESKRAVAPCAGNSDGMTDIDDAVREFASGHVAKEVAADLTVLNAPPQRTSFGLVEAVAVWADLHDPRVKLADDDTIKADPLPRLLTIVTVNHSIGGYDPETVAPSRQEKHRLFYGVTILPDFGVAGGYSFLPIRGLSINAGAALLFVKSAPSSVIGSAPPNATDPFKLGTGLTAFVGVGYAFK